MFTGEELKNWFPSYQGDFASTEAIHYVSTDSREAMTDAMFVPIAGERFDGHDFILQAVEQGAAAAIWQEDRVIPSDLPAGFPLFFVKDSLKGLQQMAVRYLHKVSPIVVGITGSNGKTTTKDMVESVLSGRFHTHKTKGNFNNHIGLPLTILAMPVQSEVLILEMGMNHFGEISFLSKLAQPDFAIITNIGESHIQNLGSREGIATAKMEIADGLKASGKIIFDGDEPLLDRLGNNNGISCGYGQQNDVQISDIQTRKNKLTFSLKKENTSFQIPLIGKHNAKNAVYAIAIGRLLGVAEGELQEGLSSLKLTGMRLEQITGKNHALLINDAYNASPTSMKASIEAVRELEGYQYKIAVLGDIYELGQDEKALHETVAEAVKPPLTHIFTVGPRAKWIADAVNKEKDSELSVASFETKEEVISSLENLMVPQAVILLKASRAIGLETVIEKLTK